MAKICTTCKIEKSETEFHLRGDKKGKNLQSQCKNCVRAKQQIYRLHHREDCNETARLWRRNNPLAVKQNNIFYKYGIMPEQYEMLFISQDFKCNVCSVEVFPYEHGSCVDHNHNTGRVRGILCTKCNIAIGWIELSNSRIENINYHLCRT